MAKNNIKVLQNSLYSPETLSLEESVQKFIDSILVNPNSSKEDLLFAMKLEEYFRYRKDTELQHFLQEELLSLRKDGTQVQLRIKSLRRVVEKIVNYLIEGKNLNKIHDFIACRIILPTDDTSLCYETMKKIIEKLEAEKMCILGIKDFIKNPKDNGYQSLHLIVATVDNKLFEMQIRTKKMHFKSEFGAICHDSYTDSKYSKRVDFDFKKVKIDEFQYDRKSKKFIDKAGLIKEINLLNINK